MTPAELLEHLKAAVARYRAAGLPSPDWARERRCPACHRTVLVECICP